MIVLGIETATSLCGIGLSGDEGPIADYKLLRGAIHGEYLPIAIEHIIEICRQNNPVISCNPEKRQESDPDCDTEIDRMNLEKLPDIRSEHGKVKEPWLPVKPDQDKTTCPGNYDSWKDKQGCDDRIELEVEDNEYNCQGEW